MSDPWGGGGNYSQWTGQGYYGAEGQQGVPYGGGYHQQVNQENYAVFQPQTGVPVQGQVGQYDPSVYGHHHHQHQQQYYGEQGYAYMAQPQAQQVQQQWPQQNYYGNAGVGVTTTPSGTGAAVWDSLGKAGKKKKKKQGEPEGESQWPQSLRDFVERVFQYCRGTAERAKAQKWMKGTIAKSKENGTMWTKDWQSCAIPSFTDSGTISTCPICTSTFVPKTQNVTILNKQRAAAGKAPVKVPRRWRDLVSLQPDPSSSGGEKIVAYTPEAVAGRWAVQFGGMRWGDWVHEQCCDTMTTKAKEFQDVSKLKYPEITRSKWVELQKWAKHVLQQTEQELKDLLVEGRDIARKRQKLGTTSERSLHRYTTNQNTASTSTAFTNQALHAGHNTSNGDEDEDENLRKSLRKDRFGQGGLMSGETLAFINKEKKKATKKSRFATKQGKLSKKKKSLEEGASGGPVVGTCDLMCPIAELEKRFRTNDFDELELPGTGFKGGVHGLAVKRFARTITEEDRKPDRLRTKSALLKTMTHLSSLMDSKRTTFEKVHRFLWDRYRAIRTDLSIQHIKDDFAVQCYEQMIRFHIIAEHELCEETATVTNPHGFNSHLNVEQMYKCLTSLFTLYDDLAKAGQPCANEPEFRAYNILLTMDTHGKYRRDEAAHTFALTRMRPEILRSDFVRYAVKLNSFYHEGNFVKFFKIVRRSPYLVSCILHAYFDPARANAVRLFSQGMYGRSTTLPVSFVRDALLMDNQRDAKELLQSFGLSVQRGEGGLLVSIGEKNFKPREETLRKRSAFISSLKGKSSYRDLCRSQTTLGTFQLL
ncbi:SAC3 family protein [Chloropicon primus]|uniref:SAC3 family protein n=1 Tax=Chloropicon primus TaxID=1764295 RepID=A0A5B8MRB9_9CHLO|nr:SAC3 family protein [Chloropicon primus]UPR02480.1 SAC3 family protein [Chloropicon primus]|mmetsp:Transcript_3376/g.9437  ORF Transcript_3376/g.9437 Transcript_3376/m.9437 type:complete len:817 (-) Transcript_3376:34-2484(-)|eukprot:QDZ23268.1 SAC3 family protein [Chloropicon primus]